jgi:hypothetical protein
MTAVANATFTAAQFNLYVRDNLNETFPAKTTGAGQIAVSTGANSIAARTVSSNTVTTSETTASGSYTDLATVGPQVTVTTGTAALVAISSSIANNADSTASFVSYAVTGATTAAADDSWGLELDGVAANNTNRFGVFHRHVGLTAGSNTFTMKYKAGSNTSTFSNRRLLVIPL